MLKLIHQSKIVSIMEQRKDGRPLEFSIGYVKRSTGERVFYPSAVLTSVYSSGATVNILVTGECQPRTIRRCLITHINGMQVYF